MKCVPSIINSQKLHPFARALSTTALILVALVAVLGDIHAADVLSFNSSTDDIITPGKITTVNFTVEMWVKPTAYQGENQLLSQYPGTGRMIIAVRYGKAGLFIGGTWVTGDIDIPLNAWSHIAITRDGATWTFYVNGQLDATKSGNSAALVDVAIRIGAINHSNAKGFRGEISDVRIWNTIRTPAEIQANYNTRLTGSESGLSYYWPLNEGSGSIATDLADSANGTINGAAWSTEVGPPFVIPGIPEGAWNITSGGHWSESANWLDSVVAAGNGGIAYFTNTPPVAVSVTNDMSDLLLGQVIIEGNSAHTITGNALTLTNATFQSLISATGGEHTFNLPLTTTPLGVFLVTDSESTMTMNDVISGPGSVIINPALSGGGKITFNANNTYKGSTTLGCGTFTTDTLANGGVASPLGASSAHAENLQLGPGTLRYTGGDVTTDRGYTVVAGATRAAAVINTDSDITFSGEIKAISGAFVKAGSGTIAYTYPGFNQYAAHEGAPNGLINIGDNGDSPTVGFAGMSILDGKIVMGAPGQTNHFEHKIEIGAYTTTNAGEETSGELEINDGTFICTATLSIGRNNGNTITAPNGTTSRLTINGGECYLYLIATGHNALAQPGFNPRSTFEINGGYVEVSRAVNIGERAGSQISMHANGGHLKVTGEGAGILLGAGTGTGTLTMLNDAIVETAGYIQLARSTGDESKGTLNLNGGTLIAQDIRKGVGLSGILNFNGGVFKPHTDGETLDGLTSANVSTNGALIDTSLAAYTLSQDLLHHAELGGEPDGGLIKLGGNTLTVDCAAPTYTGPTVVSNGTLAVSGNLPAGNALTVASNANLRLGNTADKTLSVGSLSLLGNAMVTLGFLSDGTSNDQLDIATSPTLGGGQIALVRVNTELPFTRNGSYTIMSYAGTDPVVSGVTVANPVFGKTYTFTAASGSVTLTIATDNSGASVWNINAGGAWATAGNWTITPADAAGSQIRFDDAITAPATVTSTGETVGEIYFNNSASYTIGGTGLTFDNALLDGSIVIESGAHAITAPLELADNTTVSFQGGTRLDLNAVSGGSATLTATGNGTLALNAPLAVQRLALDIPTLALASAMTLTAPVELDRTVAITPALNTTATLNSMISGSGGLTKSGSSTLETTAANTYTGPTTISAGTLRIATLADGGEPSALGAATADPGNLILGKATLHITGAGATDRGYTVRTEDSYRAAVLRVEDEVVFGGQILADSGPFLKTGPGTVYLTYAGQNYLNKHDPNASRSLQNIGVNGDGPSEGVTGFTVTQGTVVLGVPGQTNSVYGHIDIGLYTSTAPGGETAGELVLNDGVLTTSGRTVSVGRHNGTEITAPGGVSSRLTINGGVLDCGSLATGNNAAGLEGFNARPVIEVTGGEINVEGSYLSVGESPGAYASMLVSGGTVNIFKENRTLRMGGWSSAASGGGDGQVILSGDGAINVAGDVEMAYASGSHTALRLDGGTLTARNIVAGDGDQADVWFNGGTFRPHTIDQTMSGLTAAYVSTNGAVIDTSLSGYTIAQSLLSDPALADVRDGGLIKLGTNTLKLTSTENTFNGAITVSSGTLQALLSATNDLSVAADAIFDASGERAEITDLTGEGVLSNGTIAVRGVLDCGNDAAPAGATMTVENLTMAAGSTLVCEWSTNAVGEITRDYVTVTDAITSEGPGRIDFKRDSSNPIPVPFETTIISYGSFSGSFAGWKAINTGLPAGQAIATIVTARDNEVTVKITYGGTMIMIQ